MTDELNARGQMVQRQLRQRGIWDQRVLQAMAELPRERFMPPESADRAYDDSAQPIGSGQTISQPYVVALMSQELAVQPSHRVLEIGAGSGYQTAILARLAGWVYSIERLGELAQRAGKILEELGISNVSIRVADGTLGWPEEAPFDRILCAAASPDVPPAWADQLTEGGRMILPVGPAEVQQLIRVDKQAGRLIRLPLLDVRFVRLIGRHGWQEADD